MVSCPPSRTSNAGYRADPGLRQLFVQFAQFQLAHDDEMLHFDHVELAHVKTG
jgi:hypothetical protein